tara:strand:- start:585 stop:818 length:234 start_codon:yes stop_codon:yes gene_type:complete
MNTLMIHDVKKIEIETKAFDNKKRQTSVVRINVYQTDEFNRHCEDFAIDLFLDEEKNFKALDMKNLFDVIQKHTVIE